MTTTEKRQRLYLHTLWSSLQRFATEAGLKPLPHALADACGAEEHPCAKQAHELMQGMAASAGGNGKQKGHLASIFHDITVPNQTARGGSNAPHFPLRPLDTTKECFPQTDCDSKTSQKDHWDNFTQECATFLQQGTPLWGEGFLALVKRYAWCMPATPSCGTSTSLFDALKTEAALAVCLYDHSEGQPAGTCALPFLLLGGDVSGIQTYLYDIASRKAAVSLKGRSFYIQLLVNSVIRRVSNHPSIQAFPAQVVYSSGGKFYMLLPNTIAVQRAIEEVQRDIERELLAEHHGQLAFNLAAVPFGIPTSGNGTRLTFADSGQGEIGLLWKTLADALEARKRQKFRTALPYELFTPHMVDAQAHICAVTGVESDKCVPIDKNADEKTYVLPIVKRQAELGNKLKDADYIASWQGERQDQPDISILGVNYQLLQQGEVTKFKLHSGEALLQSINRTDLDQLTLADEETDTGFLMYGGNQQALTPKGENKTFEQLADGQYLGILRMDVDNLGAIFIKGLPDTAKNFAAYSTLSFQLDYFFSGYLNTIRNSAAYADHVNILYSGGDDIFAVGRWDKLILFAERIRKDFEAFTGRPDISISGGISMVGDKFPIAKAAKMAGEAEDAAKAANNGRKNAFCLLGQTVSWGDEFNFVKEEKEAFVRLIEKERMPRSILHKMQQLYEQQKAGPAYLWHATYFLTRFSERESEKVKDFCRNLRSLVCNPRKFQQVTLAARWAELELRFSELQKQ